MTTPWKTVPVEPTPEMLRSLMQVEAHADRPGTLWENTTVEEKAVALKVLRAYAQAALAAAPQQGWQPIETAPKSEETPFLVLRRGCAVQVSWFEGRLYPDALEACIDFDDGITDATHWAPLLAPPGIKQQASDEGGGGVRC